MKAGMLFFLVLITTILAQTAHAATIHGTVYDVSLKKVNAKVEINTVPKQFMVTKEGSYSFNVPKGSYILRAYIEQDNIIVSTQENITVEQDGAYVLDLILFPNIDEGLENPNVDVAQIEIPVNNSLVGGIFLLLLLIAGILVYYFKQPKVETKIEKEPEEYKDRDLDTIVKILQKEGGRATQKDLRKEMPYSEGKISLMIAELEHRGIVEKIKKGRGNIVILKKR